MSNDSFPYAYDNPYNYLKSEYLRLNYKKSSLKNINLDDLFKITEKSYDNKEKKLFESDKILFKKLKEEVVKFNLPIDEQEPCSFVILDKHSKSVIQVLGKNNICVQGKIGVGTLPLNDLNAYACDFSKEVKLVAVNQGLFQFVYLMGRVVSSFSKEEFDNNNQKALSFNFDMKEFDENLKYNVKGNAKFLEVLILYFINRDLYKSKTYYEEDQRLYLSSMLYDNAELFVVAHEYAHIISYDLSHEKHINKRFLDDESRLYAVKRNWNDEFQADQIALQITLAREDEMNFGLFGNYIGIEFLFACLDIIEKIYLGISNDNISETHPPATIRMESLRNYLKKILPEGSDTLINGGKVISYILNELWDENKSTFYKIYNSQNNS